MKIRYSRQPMQYFFLTHYLMPLTNKSTENNHRSPISPLSSRTVSSDYMSQIVFYFLFSTSVHSFHINSLDTFYWNCDVTTIDLWRHAIARYWYCEAVFVDCSCLRKLAQSWSQWWTTTVNTDLPSPCIHGRLSKGYNAQCHAEHHVECFKYLVF